MGGVALGYSLPYKVVKVVKKFPVALLGSGAPLNCLMKYAGSLDPAARCGKPYIWPQMRGCGGEVRGGVVGRAPLPGH
jgi:hypothetical protein